MKTETIVMCVVALILGMLMANMLKSVCGCKTDVVEGTQQLVLNATNKSIAKTRKCAVNQCWCKNMGTENNSCQNPHGCRTYDSTWFGELPSHCDGDEDVKRKWL